MRSLPWFLAVLLFSCAAPPLVRAADEAPAQAHSIPRKERVLLIVRDDCPKCEAELERLRRPGGPFEAMQAVGWKIGTTPDSHVQIVKRDEAPEFAKSLTATDLPAVAGIEGDEAVRYFKTGCTTPLDQWTFGWLISGKDQRPASAVSEAARVASTGNYRLRGNHWSIEGDFNPSQEKVVAHLHGPNHGHVSWGYGNIETWSLEEVRSLHDDLHEREGGTVGVANSSGSRATSNRPAYLTPKSLR